MNIKPIESFHLMDGHENGVEACEVEEVRELEANYKEVLETFIFDIQWQITEKITELKIDIESATFLYEDQIGIIEKATGLSWQELIK